MILGFTPGYLMSSQLRSLKKAVLKIFGKFLENHLRQSAY